MMNIKTCKTIGILDEEWDSYCKGFNIIFKKEFAIDFFRHKYLSSCLSYSYHSFLLNDEGEVVGACTVIPMRYYKDHNLFINGQAVDVFILAEYRTDPLMLMRMYKKLKLLLIEENVVAVMAIPNATAYPYWKNIVKWRDVGCLNYWAVPVRIGNILKTFKFVNYLSLLYSHSLLLISSLFTSFSQKEKESKYHLLLSPDFYASRFYENYEHIAEDGFECFYRIVDEDGIKTAYLLDTRRNEKKGNAALCFAVKNILTKHNIDLILYVGTMNFFQTLFIKVPRKLEPKLLPLTCDLISRDEQYKDMLIFSSWNFGLINYDVR